jgi:hypothetical protein
MTIGTRVRVTRNMCIELGLYNGAMGTVVGFAYAHGKPKHIEQIQPPPTRFSTLSVEDREMPAVLVQIDCAPGYEGFLSCILDAPNVYSFHLVPSNHAMCEGDYIRYQVPLLVAHGRTTHSIQGMTFFGDVVIDPNNRFFAGTYVAISRATSMERVHLTEGVGKQHFKHGLDYRSVVDQEYKRLRTTFPQSDDTA